jgi:hypothetical protein
MDGFLHDVAWAAPGWPLSGRIGNLICTAGYLGQWRKRFVLVMIDRLSVHQSGGAHWPSVPEMRHRG